MKHSIPRLLIAGTGSGCGKTTLAAALLGAFIKAGYQPAPFKCGPDYIDPMFHEAIAGVPSRSLDLFLCSEESVRESLVRGMQGRNIALIEGVMGLYDGVGGTTDAASSYDLAQKTKTPVILAVRPKGMSLSCAALVSGFASFREKAVAGVILNGVSPAMYAFYRDMITAQTGLPVFGFLPDNSDYALESRHLGLITAQEVEAIEHKLDMLAEQASQTIDLEGLAALAQSAPPIEAADCTYVNRKKHVRIAYARDKAFCFYYQENLERLERLGAELVPFSPMEDARFPEGADGLYLGGGYPEVYAKQLMDNEAMRASIQNAVRSGMPAVAECGGFLYLHEGLTDGEGRQFAMAGVIKGQAALGKRLGNFGYITLTAKKDNLLCRKGEMIRAHEFHYAVSDAAQEAFLAQKPLGQKSWNCIYAEGNLFAGFPHLHFGANPAFAERFIDACALYNKRRTT